MRPAWKGCARPGTSPTCWAAPSRWPTSASPKDGSPTRCGPTRTRCASPKATPLRRPEEPPTCTSASARSPTSATTCTVAHHLQLARTRRRRRPAAEPLPAARRTMLACSPPRAICQPRSSSSTRPSRCTSGTSPRTCGPSPHAVPGFTSLAETWPPQSRWARAHDLAAEDELTYLREFEHVTLAMVLLAQHRAGHSPAAAARAQTAARAAARGSRGGRPRRATCIEILVQLALACQAAGDRSRATDLLGRALAARRAARATSGSSSTRGRP